MGLFEKIIPKQLRITALEYELNLSKRNYDYHKWMSDSFEAAKDEAEFKLERLRRYRD